MKESRRLIERRPRALGRWVGLGGSGASLTPQTDGEAVKKSRGLTDRRPQALGRWGGLGGSGAPLTPQTN